MTGLAYNPGLQGTEELVQRFVARTQLLARVVEDLRARQPQHQLFIGQRGMGKTTLLRRIAAEVARDPELAARWIALTFPEEQYNVARLSDLWLNCLDALADALEQEGDTAQVEALDQFVQGLPTDEATRAPLALERLLSWTRAGRGMVLCIDNLQQLLGRLDKDERWALRKVLGEDQRLVVFAASPAPPAETTEYGEAFYDFFQAHALRGLTLDETREVLTNLALHAGKPDLAASFAKKSGRLRALHVLTGGNPRTVVQLFQVVSTSPGAEIRGQLEGLLDQCTPLYKARFEELAEQAQLVLDALAHHWDPATAAMVAERTRMDVNSVSTQLHRLHNEGLVDKVDLPGEARQGFQVSERFFNLWYLMRASRRHRGRVMSLARCLETLYDIDDLQALGAQLLGAPKEADLALALARALDPLLDPAVLLAFLAALVRANHPEDAYQIALGLRDRAEPLHAAMVAVKGQDVALLGRFAPEIAIPARDMLQVLWPEGLARPPAPRVGRKKRQ
ncbi:MAG: AAA family ATPase [Pseudomonadota bacterium]|nr:AAA family ATPase [Pseudomonadota bacterium]